jgi:hypothetical protein
MKACEDIIQRTATPEAPWVVVPADNKWFARIVVGAAVISALRGLDLKIPVVDKATMKEFDAARIALEAKNGDRSKAAQEKAA